MSALPQIADVWFKVIHDHLVRITVVASGCPYTHRCSKDVFEAVIAHIDDHRKEGVVTTSVANAIRRSATQVSVALQLLRERGIIKKKGYRYYIVPGYSNGFYEHAMAEFYALDKDKQTKSAP